MNIIVATDNKYGIGKNNDLLVSLPEDMKFFKDKTINNVIIMGRKTLESFPNKKPLKNRINIVISSDINLKIEGAIVVHTINDAIIEAKKYNKEIFVIGGASIYNQFIDIVDIIYLTRIYKQYDADTFFPHLDNKWQEEKISDKKIHNNIEYQFFKYIRK